MSWQALGNMYFAHSSLTDLKLWDFEKRCFVEVTGTEVNTGNIEKCKWSRKGFLRTRWCIRGTAVEFVNIHLFHDASNLMAMEPFPSLSKYDRELEALKPHLYEFPVKFPPSYPFEEDIQLPTHYMKTRVSESEASSGRRKLVRNQSEGSPKCGDTSAELRRLVEAPTRRRHEYGVIGDTACMGDHKVRLAPSGNMSAEMVWLPIYLRVMLQSDRGTVECSEHRVPCVICACARLANPKAKLSRNPTDPDLIASKKIKILTDSHPDQLLSDDRIKRTRAGSLNETIFRIPFVEVTSADYSSFDDIFANEINSSLLSPVQCLDPYTPESVDSHTPNAEASGSEDQILINDIVNSNIDIKSSTLPRDRSVSPTQLKNRLDKLLRGKEKPELSRLDSRESCKSDNSVKGGL
ncbi:unnamed protein product [Leptidea sinapis]|uniref:Uncharacterized protein n=1 Tax=Leptidea sinapis TaxID=189913 RepID=A0A5E4QZ79_9NEOP|nr:unnamed protein product [Leptidea sinapis]